MSDNPVAFPDLVNVIGKRGLKLGHININGLLNKISQVKALLSQSNFAVLAITETHLSDNVDDGEIKIQGYDFI